MQKFLLLLPFFVLISLLLLGVGAVFMEWEQILIAVITILTILLSIQGGLNLYWMIFAWEDPEEVSRNKSPREHSSAHFTFTALLPARFEKAVIAHTIRSINRIDYPDFLKEILVICRNDDPETIAEAQRAINELDNPNIQLLVFDDFPINKPHGLQLGLQHAKNDVVVIFDAEDEPHGDIYKIVNTVMLRDGADVVQSGVQLMNYRTNWFSTLNVLEYFFWFKSTLQFFTRRGFTPLGGNTVFFKRNWLHSVKGWDEYCLTEDADIGIRLSVAGAKFRVVYDELHTTQEETPHSVESFVKQRTRWNQGFLQIFLKGDWLRLPRLSQKLLAAYLLVWPEIQALLFLYVPVSILMMLTVKLPLIVTILTLVPLFLLVMQLVVYVIGLYEFAKGYGLPFKWWLPLKLLVTFIPYQLILGFSSLRAVGRMMAGNTAWEKTQHFNTHRINQPSTETLPYPITVAGSS